MVKENKEIEEMKKRYVSGISAIGIVAIVIFAISMLQVYSIEIQYESILAQSNFKLEKSLETNAMLNNQLLTQTLDNQTIKQDLNNCVAAYNQLYDQAAYMYQLLQDVNK